MSEPIKLPPDLLAVTLAREGVNKHRARDIECWMNEKMALAVEQATAALRAECDALKQRLGQHEACNGVMGERGYVPECISLRAEVARLTTWQPMETAPMDGTIVLLAYKNALGHLRRVRVSYMTRDLIGEYENHEIERNPGWYERSESHEEVTETVYPVSYDLLFWTALPALKEAK